MRTGFIDDLRNCKQCGSLEHENDLRDDLCRNCYYDVGRFKEEREKTKADNKWQKLKEWLNDRMEHYNDCLNENVLISSERQEVLSARYNQCFETIAQMEYIEKELEGEDEI